MTYEENKLYALNCTRKGKISIKVTGQCETWLHGIIVDGTTNAMLAHNVKFEGDDVTLRKSFITEQKEIL